MISYFSPVENPENQPYLSCLFFLRTDKEINTELRNYFKPQLKKSKMLNDDYLLFNVSNEVYFQPIHNFKDNEGFNYQELDLDYSLIENKSEYNSSYFFDLYKDEFLSKLMPKNSSPLSISFSKPVNDYLLAEIYIDKGVGETIPSKIKRGTYVHILFVFDETGLVGKALVSGYHYN